MNTAKGAEICAAPRLALGLDLFDSDQGHPQTVERKSSSNGNPAPLQSLPGLSGSLHRPESKRTQVLGSAAISPLCAVHAMGRDGLPCPRQAQISLGDAEGANF